MKCNEANYEVAAMKYAKQAVTLLAPDYAHAPSPLHCLSALHHDIDRCYLCPASAITTCTCRHPYRYLTCVYVYVCIESYIVVYIASSA